MNHKYKQLDALRWIAALAVGIGHAFLCFNVNGRLPPKAHFYGTMVFNGAYAVDLFFVLSGFVLINATLGVGIEHYAGFITRRFLRIYPAAWMSLVLSGLTVVVVHFAPRYGLPWTSPWAESLLQAPKINVLSILSSITLVDHMMNPVLWSIAIEVAASAVYPLAIYWLRKSRVTYLLLLCPAAVVMSYFTKVDLNVSNTLHFLYMFLIGAALNVLGPTLSPKLGRTLIGMGVFLMLFSRLFGQAHSFMEDFVSTVSAGAILAAIAFSCPMSIKRLLGTKGLCMLGQASYSYYLINAPLLFIMVRLYPLSGIPAPATAFDYLIYSLSFGIIASVLTVPLAYASALSVENLSIKLGRKWEKNAISIIANYRTEISPRLT
jgi:peptidoglycan/LPS O-acetylase OafA/YrhL